MARIVRRGTPPAVQFSRTEATAARDAALEVVEVAAEPSWFDLAIAALWQTAHALDEFIVDDVWKFGGLSTTRENRAIGAVITHGLRQGWMEQTPNYRPSERKTSHRNPRRVWRSCIRRAAGALDPEWKPCPDCKGEGELHGSHSSYRCAGCAGMGIVRRG
jgi:hypothetical protein